MTNDMPEEIWAERAPNMSAFGYWDLDTGNGTAYVRKDLAQSPAPASGEREKAAWHWLAYNFGILKTPVAELREELKTIHAALTRTALPESLRHWSKDKHDAYHQGLLDGAKSAPPMMGAELETAVGKAIVKEAWAIEGLPVKALISGERLLGRAAISALQSAGVLRETPK